MRDYRLYFYDRVGHINDVAPLGADDDDVAVEAAATKLHGEQAELWRREWFVYKFEPDRSVR